MMFENTKLVQKQRKMPLTLFTGILTLIALSIFFLTSWPYRGLVLFVAYPIAFAIGVLSYHHKRRTEGDSRLSK